jgi:predicted phage terminase large subunit-like protein
MEKSALPWLQKRMAERNVFCALTPLPSHHEKSVKARSFQAIQSAQRVYWPESMPWAEDVIDELLRFPTGKHDDAVDACGNMGRALAEMWAANPPKPKPATIVDAWNAPLRAADLFQLPRKAG